MDMKVVIKDYDEGLQDDTIQMITDFFNHHRKLTNAPKKYWQTNEESKETLKEWLKEGSVYNIFFEDKLAGFFCVKFGGQSAAWLEDIFVKEEFRGKGIGKFAIEKLDELMKEKGIVSMFLDVIPRNTEAIKFYKECGFDHLNMIQLRKNYDKSLDKNEDVDILGFKFKKY